MKKTFLAICAVAVGLLTMSSCGKLEDSIAGLQGDLDALTARVDKLEKDLNADIANLNTLQAKVNDLETSLNKAIADGDKAVTDALEAKLAALETKLTAAQQAGDKAIIDELLKEKENLTTALTQLQKGLEGVTGSVANLQTALAALEATVGTNYEALLAKMDAADNVIDGKVTDLAAALEEVKKAYLAADAAHTAKDAELAADLAEAIAKIAVVEVAEVDGKIVLTLATGEKIEVSKPLENVDNEGLVTTVEVDGVKYWAVIVNGEPQSLNIAMGSDVNLVFDVNENNELVYSTNGTDWIPTGAFVSDSAEKLLADFYQGETGEYEYDEYWNAIPVLEDFYTMIFGGETYYLPLYKVDNSVVTIKAGKTYFDYEESKTVDVAITDVTAMYVMTKPDGWRAKLDGKKLTVTAPSEANVTSGAAEADGEVLLHCTTVEGNCKVAKLAVATSEGFSLTVVGDSVKFYNPVVVTTTENWDNESTDFRDMFVGLAPIADFEADPAAYINALYNYEIEGISTYLSNIKGMLKNPLSYIEGQYEVDEFTLSIADIKAYADWMNPEYVRGTHYIVWAVPQNPDDYTFVMDELVFDYYQPVEAVMTVADSTFNDITLNIELYGADSWVVGMYSKEDTFNWNTQEYDLATALYQWNAFQAGYATAADALMGIEVEGGASELDLSNVLGMGYETAALKPNTTYYVYAMPMYDDKANADYVFVEDVLPYVHEFSTSALVQSDACTATVEFTPEVSYTDIYVDLTLTSGAMMYYNWYTAEELDGFEDDATLVGDLIAYGYMAGESANANKSDLNPETSYNLVVLAIDENGTYKEPIVKPYTTKSLPATDSNILVTVESVDYSTPKSTVVTFNVTGATKFSYMMGYSQNTSWAVNTAKYGVEATYYTPKWADVVDGKVTITVNAAYQTVLTYGAYNCNDTEVTGMTAVASIDVSTWGTDVAE